LDKPPQFLSTRDWGGFPLRINGKLTESICDALLRCFPAFSNVLSRLRGTWWLDTRYPRSGGELVAMETGFTDEEVARAEQSGLAAYKRYEIHEAAEHLGLDTHTVVKLVDEGELGSLKVGKNIFVLGGHIVQWKAGGSAKILKADSMPPSTAPLLPT
jgi:excisionase family DNA binding protein